LPSCNESRSEGEGEGSGEGEGKGEAPIFTGGVLGDCQESRPRSPWNRGVNGGCYVVYERHPKVARNSIRAVPEGAPGGADVSDGSSYV